MSAAPRVKPRPSDARQASKADTANTAVRPYRVRSCILGVVRCALVAAVLLAIVTAAIGCYDEAPRLRAPIDWAVILVTCLAVPHIVLPVARAWLQRSPSHTAKNAERNVSM